jgi:hypothetical protein
MPSDKPEPENGRDAMARLTALVPDPPPRAEETDSTWRECPDWSVDLDSLYGRR